MRALRRRAKGRRGGCEPARHHGPEAAYRGVGGIFQSRVARCTANARGHALADGMRALALDAATVPTHASRAIVHAPGPRVGAARLDPRPPFVVYGFRDKRRDGRRDVRLVSPRRGDATASRVMTSHVAAALIAWRWLVEAEEQTPWPSIVGEEARWATVLELTLAKIAPLADALSGRSDRRRTSSRGWSWRPWRFKGAAGDGGRVRRRARAHAQASGCDGEDRGRGRAGTGEERVRQGAGAAQAATKLDVLRQCLEAPARRARWPRVGPRQAPDGERVARTARGGTGGRAGSAVLARRRRGGGVWIRGVGPGSRPRRGGVPPPWLSDASAVADVVGAALNALRFVLMREGGSGPAEGSPPAGAWARRRELIDTARRRRRSGRGNGWRSATTGRAGGRREWGSTTCSR